MEQIQLRYWNRCRNPPKRLEEIPLSINQKSSCFGRLITINRTFTWGSDKIYLSAAKWIIASRRPIGTYSNRAMRSYSTDSKSTRKTCLGIGTRTRNSSSTSTKRFPWTTQLIAPNPVFHRTITNATTLTGQWRTEGTRIFTWPKNMAPSSQSIRQIRLSCRKNCHPVLYLPIRLFCSIESTRN